MSSHVYSPSCRLTHGTSWTRHVLDNFYVATRYANGHPYGRLQSDDAIKHAREIVAFVRAHLA